MTPEMSFEALLISSDPGVFCPMSRVLDDFSITTNICLTHSKATDLLQEGSTDLVVIDWEENSADLLHEIRNPFKQQKPTILAISAFDCTIPGVHVLARKPVSYSSGTVSMRAAYARMVSDFRRHVRYAVMAPVQATNDSNREISLTVTNVGDGGVGLTTKERLSIGDVLSFSIPLPGIEAQITVQARVLWTRQYGAAGCEFVQISSSDLEVFTGWLRSRCRIKRPLIDVGTRE